LPSEVDSASRRVGRYGQASFVAVVANVAVLNLPLWFFAIWAWWGFLYLVPFVVVDVLASVLLTFRPGAAGQIGRGMLIGCVSVLMSVAVLACALALHRFLDPH
jgi:hypothetical protein